MQGKYQAENIFLLYTTKVLLIWVELKDGEWKVVEYDTLEKAEQKEKEYKDFWKDSNR